MCWYWGRTLRPLSLRWAPGMGGQCLECARLTTTGVGGPRPHGDARVACAWPRARSWTKAQSEHVRVWLVVVYLYDVSCMIRFLRTAAGNPHPSKPLAPCAVTHGMSYVVFLKCDYEDKPTHRWLAWPRVARENLYPRVSLNCSLVPHGESRRTYAAVCFMGYVVYDCMCLLSGRLGPHKRVNCKFTF